MTNEELIAGTNRARDIIIHGINRHGFSGDYHAPTAVINLLSTEGLTSMVAAIAIGNFEEAAHLTYDADQQRDMIDLHDRLFPTYWELRKNKRRLADKSWEEALAVYRKEWRLPRAIEGYASAA